MYAVTLLPIVSVLLCAVYLRFYPPLPRAFASVSAIDAPLPSDPRPLGDMLIAARGAAQVATEQGRLADAEQMQQRVDRILRALRQAQSAPPDLRRGALHW